MSDTRFESVGGESGQLGELKSAVLDATPASIAITDREGIIVWVNPAFRQLTGYTIAKGFSAIFSPDSPADLMETIPPKGLESEGWNGECIIRRPNGTDVPVFLNVRPIKDREGYVTGTFGIAQDIRERKKVEESLRRSEEQFRELAEHIRAVFFVSTPEPFAVTYISPAYDLIWGRPRQLVYDHPAAWIDAIHPEDRQRVFAVLAESQRGAETKMEYRIVRPDGSVRWISNPAL